VNNEGLTIADSSALDPDSSLTVSLWIRADSWAGGAKILLQKGSAIIQYALAQEGADSLSFTLGGPVQGSVLKAPLPGAGAWHLLAATYDGARGSLYVDGRLAAAQAVTGRIPVTQDELCLGCRPAQGKPRNSFKGLLDEAAVSRRARTPDFLKLA